MPPKSGGRLRVGRYFLSLFLILAALYSIVIFSSQSNAPKLGLDLEGGAQIVFKAVTTNGKAPSKDSMKVAREILTTRVNGAGVSEADVVQEGSDRIVVSVPGKSVADIASIGAAAQLNFRPIVVAPIPANPTPTPSGSATASPSGSGATTPSGSTTGTATPRTGATTSGAETRPTGSSSGTAATGSSGTAANNIAAAPTTASSPTAGSTPSSPAAGSTGTAATPSPSASSSSASAAELAKAIDPLAGLKFAIPKNGDEFTALSAANKTALLTKLAAFNCKQKVIDDRTKPMVACSQAAGAAQLKYLLGPVIVPGNQISTARAVAPNPGQQGGSSVWTVALDLKSSGQKAWAEYTGKYHQDTSASGGNQGSQSCNPDFTGQSAQSGGLPCAQYVAFTLDGKVISDPHNEATINGTTSITGNFQEDSATDLANQLKFGALPLNFVTQTSDNITATLGTGQLKAGLLAGGIGLVLVVLYSLLYYRGLGFVTIASLLVSGALTYALLVILGREIGFTLTLAGIAGFIVAVGITADSFVVYFERIKDEVHDGRSFATAVPRAWARARRTIISADIVSLLAAVILYALSAGDVRGFAFTLGLSTLLDLVIVFLFTHPLVALLARSRAFGSPRFTGLNAVRSLPAVTVEQERLEVAAGASPRSGRASRRGGTALLERDTGTGPEDDDDILDLTTPAEPEPEREPEPTPAPAEPEPAEDHKASASTAAARRRARAERDAIVDTGMSAAERAAARRGRTARPPREQIAETEIEDTDVEDTEVDDVAVDDSVDESDTVEETPSRSRRGLRRRGRASAPGLAEIPEPALEPADEVVPVDEEIDDRPVVDTSTRDEPLNDEPVDADPAVAPAVEADPAAPVDTSTAKPAGKAASAAERAAARRARLRAKASDTEGDAS